MTWYVTQLKGVLNAVQQEYLTMLSANEVQQHLSDQIFYGLHKQLQDSMHYLYDDARITYHTGDSSLKPESKQEDCAGEGIHVKSIEAEGRDDIVKLSEQIVQL